MSTKYSIMRCLSMIGLFSMSMKMYSAEEQINVHNGTDENICVAYVKTDFSAREFFSKNRYQIMYDDEYQIETKILPAGSATFFKSYERSASNYDRTLWVVSRGEDNCASLQSLIEFGKGSKAYAAISALELGSKTDVVIVSAGTGKYKLKSWTDKLGEDLNKRKDAMMSALEASGLTWEDLSDASQEQWNKIKKAFNDFYKKVRSKPQSKTSGKTSNWAEKIKSPAGIDWRLSVEAANLHGLNLTKQEAFDLLNIKQEDIANIKNDAQAMWNIIKNKAKIALKPLHPDRNRTKKAAKRKEAEEQFKQIQGAYESLGRWLGKVGISADEAN